MTIDGKLYHVSKNGYAIDRYAKGLHEIDGGMYYVKEDGSFLTNSAVEYLTFDANGRYTSGNATLDSYVDQALAACTNSGMTKAQKLRAGDAIEVHMRGGNVAAEVTDGELHL